MNRERARYLLDNRLWVGNVQVEELRTWPRFSDGLTPREREDVNAQWATMRGSSCFMDALKVIAKSQESSNA